MRWSMLQVSVAIHVTALVMFFIAPLAADIDLPVPWPASSRQYVAATAVPAPVPEQPRRAQAFSDTAPIRPPDRIADEIPPLGSTVSEYGLPSLGQFPAGVPSGLNVGAVEPPPPPPPPVPAAPQIHRVGGAIREPRKIVDAPVVYPEIARQARVEGLVILEATIDERGFVTGARVLRSRPMLDAAALAAVRQWRYTPTLLNGVPVPVLMTITFNFQLSAQVP